MKPNELSPQQYLAYLGEVNPPPKRRMRPTYAKWGGLLGVAFILWALHGAFHVLADWLDMGYDNPLGTLFGPNPIGANAHVLLELVIGFALGAALIREVIRWRSS